MIIPLRAGAYPLGELADTLSATALFCEGVPPHAPSRLVTDSREVREGDLFCALRGEDDGHKYIKEAVARGAAAVLSEEALEGVPMLLVPSTREALLIWATAARRRLSRCIRIGVTGSVGKTTTKETLAALFDGCFCVHKTEGNRNNGLGVPFTLLSAPTNTELLLCEIGVSATGEMRPLAAALSPHIALITCIGHAHIGAFGTRAAIAAEKATLLAHTVDGGAFFCPIGEPLLTGLPLNGIHCFPVSPLSVEEGAQYGLSLCEQDLPRRHALGYAAAIGRYFSLSNRELEAGLQRAAAIECRRREVALGSLLLLIDAYNASPESTMAALLYLDARAEGRRVAVLGTMQELGRESARHHRALGRFAAAHTDCLFFFGEYAEALSHGARAAGAKQVFILSGDHEEMASSLGAHLSHGDTVLFKASRTEGADEIAASLIKQNER